MLGGFGQYRVASGAGVEVKALDATRWLGDMAAVVLLVGFVANVRKGDGDVVAAVGWLLCEEPCRGRPCGFRMYG